MVMQDAGPVTVCDRNNNTALDTNLSRHHYTPAPPVSVLSPGCALRHHELHCALHHVRTHSSHARQLFVALCHGVNAVPHLYFWRNAVYLVQTRPARQVFLFLPDLFARAPENSRPLSERYRSIRDAATGP